jgi:hypothetical protein
VVLYIAPILAYILCDDNSIIYLPAPSPEYILFKYNNNLITAGYKSLSSDFINSKHGDSTTYDRVKPKFKPNFKPYVKRNSEWEDLTFEELRREVEIAIYESGMQAGNLAECEIRRLTGINYTGNLGSMYYFHVPKNRRDHFRSVYIINVEEG